MPIFGRPAAPLVLGQLALGLGQERAGDLREGAARRGNQQRAEVRGWLERDDGEPGAIQPLDVKAFRTTFVRDERLDEPRR